jgi:N-acetylmuramoyl-L-alanine amidase
MTLAGCATTPFVDRRYSAVSQDSRVQFIVLHATELDLTASLERLTHQEVSSHYLVARDGHVYGLVPEERRAWHSGPSYWQGATPLNPSSIGIEIVNVADGDPQGRASPYTDAQMSAVVTLVADVAARHHVQPHRIVGHGEVLPEDKTDPGALFPWRRLELAGLVPSIDTAAVERARRELDDVVPDAHWFQSHLSVHGHRVPCSNVFDEATRRVIAVFQSRHRPSDARGVADLETAALLAAVTADDGLVIRSADGRVDRYRIEPTPIDRCAAPATGL